MAAELALDVVLASFIHCRLTIQLLHISEPTEKFNALILDHVEDPWPYMVRTRPSPRGANFRVLGNRGTCILYIFLTTNALIWHTYPGLMRWSYFILHQTYYLSIRVVQPDTSLPPWSSQFNLNAFLKQPRYLENWVVVDVVLGSTDDYTVKELSSMCFYCSREEVVCLKSIPLSTQHDDLYRQMFPLSWPAGSFNYKKWPMHFLTPVESEWFHKGGSKVAKLLNPPPFRFLLPKDVHTGHIFENRILSDLIFHFNASLTVSSEVPKYAPLTFIKIRSLSGYKGGQFVFHRIPQVGFVYCTNKTSPQHYIASVASPLDWPTWTCAAGVYVAMCVTVRMISGRWQLLNLFVGFLAQAATLCLRRFQAVFLLWVITATFFGWFFTSSIEALLVSPTLPTGINDMEGLFNNGYTIVMDVWSAEGMMAINDRKFMSETAYLRGLKAGMHHAKVWNIYDEWFLRPGLTKPKRALVLQPEQGKVLLIELQEQLKDKQCFGTPNALNMYPEAIHADVVNGRMVRDAVVRLKAVGLGLWYAKNAAISLAYEWTLRFRKSLKAVFPDQVKDSGLVKEWNVKRTPLEGFHKTNRYELKALLAVCSSALAVAFAVLIVEVFHVKILLVSAKLSIFLRHTWQLALEYLSWIFASF